MTKPNLTPEGVAAKINELYERRDGMYADIKIIEINFAQFIMDHFELTESELRCLIRLDLSNKNTFGKRCKIALQNKLPIKLIYSTLNEKDQSKCINLVDNLNITTEDNGRTHASGSITFQIFRRETTNDL